MLKTLNCLIGRTNSDNLVICTPQNLKKLECSQISKFLRQIFRLSTHNFDQYIRLIISADNLDA